MNKGLVGFMVGACVGGAVGYSVRGESRQPEATTQSKSVSTVSPAATVEKEADRAPDRSEAAIPPSASNASNASNSAPSSPDVDHGQPRSPDLGLPGGKLDSQRPRDAAPMDKLLNSMSAYCQFDAGAGGQWPHGKIMAHGAAWQGGPLEFEAINLVDQTAQMTRNPWTAATPEGIPLRATATNTGLHLSGFKPDGELMVVTVFGALDSDARQMAVVSLHGTNLDHESAQFYGWCSVR